MSLQFYKTESTSDAGLYLAKKVNDHLFKNERVLLFLSGGSAIEVALAAAKAINQSAGHLAIALIDERYGSVGHADSNAQQLKTAGFNLHFEPILKGKDMAATARDFDQWLKDQFKNADYKIALLGIGWGGHTSGILPGSPALKSKDLVCTFSGPDFERITTTERALELLDAAVVYSVGESKRPELVRLEDNLSIDEQPAQILKKIPDVAIFNDYKGEKI